MQWATGKVSKARKACGLQGEDESSVGQGPTRGRPRSEAWAGSSLRGTTGSRGSGLEINRRRNTGVKTSSIPCYGGTETP